ncbi:hypothetical protein GCM10023108_19280 [Saccharopolyspora hordei]
MPGRTPRWRFITELRKWLDTLPRIVEENPRRKSDPAPRPRFAPPGRTTSVRRDGRTDPHPRRHRNRFGWSAPALARATRSATATTDPPGLNSRTVWPSRNHSG